MLQNVKDLLPIYNWNYKNNVKVFRMSSEITPWASEYELHDLPDYEEICHYLKIAGDYTKVIGQRVSFHPGQFNCLASEKPHVVDNCIKDLEIHGKLFDLMGLDQNHWSKINIHLGSTCGGNLQLAANNFNKNFMRLSDSVKSRLTVENDDKPAMFSTKFLYDNRKYFENNGLLNLMRSTDLLNNTPIEVYRDKFDVSTDDELINCWISNDRRNFLAVRYLRSNCTEMLLRTMGFTKDFDDDAQNSGYSIVKDKKFGGRPPYYRARVFADKLDIKKEISTLRDKVGDEYLSSSFLDYEKSENLTDILKEELNQTYKAFVWTIFNLNESSDVEFSSNDKFGGYNLKNSYFNYNIKIKTNEDNIFSTFKYELFIDKEDKKLNDETDEFNIHIKEEVVLDLVGKGIPKDKSVDVESDYLDSKNFYKHKLNLPRTELTNQW